MSSNLAQELWLFKRSVSLDQVTRHYRKLCKLYHPDLKSPEDRAAYEAHMQEINASYQDALKRFNIYTFKKPKTVPRPDNVGLRVGFVNRPKYTAHSDEAESKKKCKPTAVRSPIPNRLLASALASLKQTRTFFSLKSADELSERVHYRAAIEEMISLRQRFPNSSEAQDALYYLAIASCNLKEYEQALKHFAEYRKEYPNDERKRVFNFYEGVCNHRLGNFDDAVQAYGRFLMSKPPGMYSHFVALVATFKDSAEAGVIPMELPYG